ncbi:MAG: aminotransferase class IV [Aliiglaciecola sp.]|uniref:aminotransferase class IV n=1 Tax=Aliiglaciecola sp. TaxID=1872441 RepID=UPI003297441E
MANNETANIKMDNNDSAAYFNGQYLPLSQVSISPLDRGFLFGDGIYEFVPVFNGKALGGEQHWQRLLEGLKSVDIPLTYSVQDLKDIAQPLLSDGEPTQILYVQITRGVEAVRKHRFPVDAKPTVLMFSTPFTSPFDITYPGCDAYFQEDLRWQRCSIKSISLMGNVMSYLQLAKDGVANSEALLIRGEHVVEAPSSNLFMAKGGVVFTPPVDNILAGVTRQLIIDIAENQGIEVRQVFPTVSEVKQADEVWVSNSYEELKPIISIDGDKVGDGKPGPIWQRLFSSYQLLKH